MSNLFDDSLQSFCKDLKHRLCDYICQGNKCDNYDNPKCYRAIGMKSACDIIDNLLKDYSIGPKTKEFIEKDSCGFCLFEKGSETCYKHCPYEQSSLV